MKSNSLMVVLVLLCLGLALALFVTQNAVTKEKQAAQVRVQQLSNDWTRTSAQLIEQQKVNIVLETNLAARTEDLKSISNEMAVVASKLAKSENDAKVAAQQAQEEIARRDAKINELETQKDDLSKRMSELNTSLSNLERQISDTEKKLAASEGDRSFLLKELKRMQAEKAELERQFNNLAFLREQVRKLSDELSVARRLEWIRRGIYGFPKKGGESMQRRETGAASPTNFHLNVELKQDGGVKVIVPATNAPANKPK